jgi:Tfp pilus assembly protein PilN
LIGGGLQKLTPTRLAVPAGESPQFQLNLHPQRNQLSRNRQFKAVAKSLNWASVAAIASFAIWVTADFGVDFLRLQTSSQQVKSDLTTLETRQNELNQMTSTIQAAEAQIASLVKADVINAKSKFVMTLPSLLPNGVELSSMSVNDSTISLTGVALTNVGPQAFLNNIINSRLIKAPLLEVNRAESGKITFKIEGVTGMVN